MPFSFSFSNASGPCSFSPPLPTEIEPFFPFNDSENRPTRLPLLFLSNTTAFSLHRRKRRRIPFSCWRWSRDCTSLDQEGYCEPFSLSLSLRSHEEGVNRLFFFLARQGDHFLSFDQTPPQPNSPPPPHPPTPKPPPLHLTFPPLP